MALTSENNLNCLDISENPGFKWDLAKFDVGKLVYFSCWMSDFSNLDSSKNKALSTVYDERMNLKRIFGKWNHKSYFYIMREGFRIDESTLRKYDFYYEEEDYYLDHKSMIASYGYTFSDELEDAFHHKLKRYLYRA